MLENISNQFPIPSENPFNKVLSSKHKIRLYVGAFSGILAGVLLFGSLESGAKWYFEHYDQSGQLLMGIENINWNLISWGDHWLFRILASLVSAWWGGFIGGLIARRKGSYMGVVTAIPNVIFWFSYLYFSIKSEFFFSGGYWEIESTFGNKLTAGILALTNIPIAIFGGISGEELGLKFKKHFDFRAYTLLGIKWYHYFWIPIPLHLFIRDSSSAVLISSGFISWAWNNIYDILPMIVLLPLYGAFYLTFIGMMKAYLILSGIKHITSLKDRVKGVLKFGFGYPLLAIAIRFGINSLVYGVSKLFD